MSTASPTTPTLYYDRPSLSAIFAPTVVAVIGASEEPGSVGRTLLHNLLDSPFGGTVYPVNPKRHSVLGVKAYPHIADVPDPVDLAIIATPAHSVPEVVGECTQAKVKGVIIASAGFRESGTAGAQLEKQVTEQARTGNMRIIGPSSLGVMRPPIGLNATFARAMPRPGNIAFVTQSAALGASILDWGRGEQVGFSAFVSTGTMLDVDWSDIINFLDHDSATHSILVYMESIRDPRSFISAARKAAYNKPIIVLKGGRSETAARAVEAHTGRLAGSDEVLEAAFRRCGVLRVDQLADLFSMAEVLTKQPRPKGPRLMIVTNAGGPGVIATDTLVAGGGELAELSFDTIASLNQMLPAQWSHGNPIDIRNDATPERYAQAVEVLSKDKNSDGLLVILTPLAVTDPTQAAEGIKPFVRIPGKPILACWMGGAEVEEGTAILNAAGIPTFTYPDTAVRVFNYMWRYSYNIRGIYETPVLPAALADGTITSAESAGRIIQAARDSRRTLLNVHESFQLLSAYRIPVVETRVATSEADAVQAAEEIGYPVVLKLFSDTITHKSEAGGVQLSLKDADSVRQAYHAIQTLARTRLGGGEGAFLGVIVQPMINTGGYELIIGSTVDPLFGPVILFGTGGRHVEVIKDTALGIPPLNTTLARRMMEQTRLYAALKRDGVDLESLEQALVQFSQLVVEQPRLREIEINPLAVSGNKLMALDARAILHPSSLADDQLPLPVIRPYPTRYVSQGTLRDGSPITLRPIRPEDEPLMVVFHGTLSQETVFLRYFHMMGLDQRTAHERLARICFIDYDREMALVVERKDPETGARGIIGVGRLTKAFGRREAEFAILISDRYQRHGLGSELLRRLIEIGRDEGLQRITGEFLPDNTGMRSVCQRLGFHFRRAIEDPTVVQAEIEL
ncbi:MAG TPA: bifunctional acetate--CoA ligase family protein/GNAT family N-acetyltransferase [Anaerolineales bacterium]|nr:bifunctional acetate--CoA ligase family protein/GNAT family N-acetyltransferase [Anaerolineales bacterium]